jgi:hypothetical protein
MPSRRAPKLAHKLWRNKLSVCAPYQTLTPDNSKFNLIAVLRRLKLHIFLALELDGDECSASYSNQITLMCK